MRHGPSQDYYALLGIASSATASQLRSAWRQLALKWHPDRAGDAATATFQKLQAADTVLAAPSRSPSAALDYELERRLLDLRPDVPALRHRLQMPDVGHCCGFFAASRSFERSPDKMFVIA